MYLDAVRTTEIPLPAWLSTEGSVNHLSSFPAFQIDCHNDPPSISHDIQALAHLGDSVKKESAGPGNSA